MEVTEHQLRLIANCIEDCHRFMAGEYELFHMTSLLEKRRELREGLKDLKPLITPAIPDCRDAYNWSGANCPNEDQRRFIAETYCIYREIIHMLTILNHPDSTSVYNSSTLTCDEGGPLPVIKKL